MCRQGEIIGQNNQFVFIAGFTNIEGVGYLCTYHYNKQKKFCDISSYFGLKNVINLLNLQIL